MGLLEAVYDILALCYTSTSCRVGGRNFLSCFSTNFFMLSLFFLQFRVFPVFWLCTGDLILIPFVKHLLFRRQGMLTKGGGDSEIGMSTRATPVICPYVSWMSFFLCFGDMFVYKFGACADVYILCFLHCTASVGHISDELTVASWFAIVCMFYRDADALSLAFLGECKLQYGALFGRS